MEYLLKISSIGNDEERQEQVSGLLPDVYQYMRENCKAGEVADIYGDNEYIEKRPSGLIAAWPHCLTN